MNMTLEVSAATLRDLMDPDVPHVVLSPGPGRRVRLVRKRTPGDRAERIALRAALAVYTQVKRDLYGTDPDAVGLLTAGTVEAGP